MHMRKNLATVQQTYEYQIEDYQDKVTVLSTKLSELQEQKKQQYLYAEMNGTVSYVKDNLEGTSSVAGEHIITVMDDSECTFVQARQSMQISLQRSDGGNENQWYFWELFCYSLSNG